MPHDRSIHRYEVPVDDQWHRLQLGGDPVHVATRRGDVVEVWAWSDPHVIDRWFRVYATGEPIPGPNTPGEPGQADQCVRHRGTAITPDGRLVWHLLELVYPAVLWMPREADHVA